LTTLDTDGIDFLRRLLAYLENPSHARRVLAVYWVLLFISTHMPSIDMGEDSNQFGMFQLDKTIHVIAFAGLMFLLWRARLASIVWGDRASNFANAAVGLCLAVVYALVDEVTQTWAGRDVSMSDVVAGLVGIVGVFLMVTAAPPRERANTTTVMFRWLAGAAIAFFIFSALMPLKREWLQSFSQQVFQPWDGFDKAGHFYYSIFLTLLLAAASPAGVKRPAMGVFLTILVIGLSGPIIETGQSLTGRSVDMADLYAHQVGLLTAMLALTVVPVGRAVRMRLRDRSEPDA